MGRIWMGAVALLLASACGSGPGDEPAAVGLVVSKDLWVAMPAQDPFWPDSAAAEPHLCSPQDWRSEPNGIEVQTVNCNYITLTQPLMKPVRAGQSVRLQVWWQTLASLEPAEGRIAVWIGDWRYFDERVPIPSEADARNLSRPSPSRIAAGTPVYFHVDNHGFNSWTLGSLVAERGED